MFFEFKLFLKVGVVGFLVDTITFLVILGTGATPEISKIVSFVPAVLTTYIFNRKITFTAETLTLYEELKRLFLYIVAQISGLIVNYQIFLLILEDNDLRILNIGLSICIGAVAGLTSNFLLSKLVFSLIRQRHIERRLNFQSKFKEKNEEV